MKTADLLAESELHTAQALEELWADALESYNIFKEKDRKARARIYQLEGDVDGLHATVEFLIEQISKLRTDLDNYVPQLDNGMRFLERRIDGTISEINHLKHPAVSVSEPFHSSGVAGATSSGDGGQQGLAEATGYGLSGGARGYAPQRCDILRAAVATINRELYGDPSYGKLNMGSLKGLDREGLVANTVKEWL